MKITRLEIPDVLLIEPKVFGDSRGFFYESYRKDAFSELGIEVDFVQDNHSRSAKGVLRGLHFQRSPRQQAKLVRVVRGEVLDVAVDIRKGSPTFGRSVAVNLSEENRRMLFIPEGFAHGFCVLKDDTEFLYKCSEIYSPEHEGGLLWSDPALKIEWPRLDCDYILSDKDRAYPLLKDLEPLTIPVRQDR